MQPLSCTYLVLASSFAGTFMCSPMNNLLDQEYPLAPSFRQVCLYMWGQVLRCPPKTSNACRCVGSSDICEVRPSKLLKQWGHHVPRQYPDSVNCIKLSKSMTPKLSIPLLKLLIILLSEVEWHWSKVQAIPTIFLMWFLFTFVSAVRARHIKKNCMCETCSLIALRCQAKCAFLQNMATQHQYWAALAEDYCKFAYPIRASIKAAY